MLRELAEGQRENELILEKEDEFDASKSAPLKLPSLLAVTEAVETTTSQERLCSSGVLEEKTQENEVEKKNKKIPKRGKKAEVYKLFRDPAGEPRLPLTLKKTKDDGYDFQAPEPPPLQPMNPDPPLPGENSLLNQFSHIPSFEGVGDLNLLHQPHEARLGTVDATLVDLMPSQKKKTVRQDIIKGAYRSRLKYTLFEKRLALQTALFEYEKSTSIEDKQKHFQSKRLVTKGIPSKEYVVGYNPKTAYGLLAVCNLLLREGCCTMTQAADEYMKVTASYAATLGIKETISKKINVIARLRLVITEQLPIVRISGERLGIMYVDGVQHRQTYFLFPNLADESITDDIVVGALQRLIDLKLKTLSMENAESSGPGRPRKRKRSMQNELDRSSLPDEACNEIDMMQQLENETDQLRRESGSIPFSKDDKKLLAALYGQETMGIIEFKNMKPTQKSFFMPEREECMIS